MAQVELKCMYINISVNNGSKKLQKKTATSGKLITAVYVFPVSVQNLLSSRLLFKNLKIKIYRTIIFVWV
jgi:hypothetical protein